MKSTPNKDAPILARRSFLRAGAAGAAALTWSKQSAQAAEPSDAVNIAMIGCGDQGEALYRALGKASAVPFRWVAVCDIQEAKGKPFANRLGLKGGDTGFYSYTSAEKMLEKHPEIDAVFITAPDWQHEPLTTLCLKAGKQVYCEKMMSNTIEGAAKMVRSQRETGHLLQIGHQRRSNPRYIRCKEDIIHKLKVCGTMTHAFAQWNRGVTLPRNAKFSKEQEALIIAQGYPNTFEFMNWRWYAKYGGGPLSDLGAHQIDIFNWMFNATPKSVVASGGVDYFKNVSLKGMPPISFEHPDNVIATYEYDVPGNGLVRAIYQVVTSNSSMNFYEKYMGDKGTVVISESGDDYNKVYREKWDDDEGKWEREFFGKGYLKKSTDLIRHKFWERAKPWYQPEAWLDKEGAVDVRASKPLDPYELPTSLNVPAHTPHVENFLQVVHRKGKQTDLNCPVEEAYKCAVAVLKVNELVTKGGGRLDFKPEDFIVPA
jgi:predicted dehydrogenase